MKDLSNIQNNVKWAQIHLKEWDAFAEKLAEKGERRLSLTCDGYLRDIVGSMTYSLPGNMAEIVSAVILQSAENIAAVREYLVGQLMAALDTERAALEERHMENGTERSGGNNEQK